MEIWKDIKGFEGYYQISNLGRVKSLLRVVPRGPNGKTTIYERIMREAISNPGYSGYRFHKDGKGIFIRTHRLLAEAFIPNPNKKPCVNHKNGIITDNAIQNLEWCTHSENHLHSYRELGRIPGMTGVKGKHNHLSKPVVKLDLNDNVIEVYECAREASDKNNMGRSSINMACIHNYISKGKYKFRYKTT